MSPKHTHKDRAIIHVDMDAFYASVEVMDDPALVGKPVIVGGTPESRGVVSAASYEARRFGVHSAMSAARARKLCAHGVFLAPRMARYAELSRRIRAILDAYTPLVEPISLDEAFLDITGSRLLFGSGPEIGRAVKRRIREEVGLVASVGVAPNKFLAKLASDLEKPDGFVVIAPGEATARLADLPVSRLWGVGKVAEKKLLRQGIRLVREVVRTPAAELEKIVGSYATRLKQLAVGLDDRPVVADEDAKSLSAETTFARDIESADELRAVLDELADRVGRRTRSHGFAAHTIQIKARYADFSTVTRAHTLTEPTAQTTVIRDTARDLLEVRLDRKGRALRLLGVGVSHLVRAEETPGLLFEDARSRKHRAIDSALDDLRERFGGAVIRRGNRERRG